MERSELHVDVHARGIGLVPERLDVAPGEARVRVAWGAGVADLFVFWLVGGRVWGGGLI